jgi:hypothetical protein
VQQLLQEGLIDTGDGTVVIDNDTVTGEDGSKKTIGGSVEQLQTVLDEIEAEGKVGS